MVTYTYENIEQAFTQYGEFVPSDLYTLLKAASEYSDKNFSAVIDVEYSTGGSTAGNNGVYTVTIPQGTGPSTIPVNAVDGRVDTFTRSQRGRWER